mmetsp:Transcript_2821/g.8425  ORF Transcript_2821/g.8425 Transcript_2821/m.8425 type:complete len:306 (+) Transcript_2821:985-1902(+)
MGRSSIWKAAIMPWILSPPKMRKRLSSRERKYRVEPGSPWRPDRPRNWLSIRLDSCLSVPTTCRPPSSCTSTFSSSVTFLKSASILRKAARIFWTTGSSVGAFSQANARRSSASSSASWPAPHDATAASTASLASFAPSSLTLQGYNFGLTFHELIVSGRRRRGPSSSSTRLTTLGMSISRILSLAINSGLPPSRISVPRPAMLVAIVTAPLRPLCATISLSRSTFSGLAFRTSNGIPACSKRLHTISLRSTLVVPTNTGLPVVCILEISCTTAFHLPVSVLNTTSGLSVRLTVRLVGTTVTARS